MKKFFLAVIICFCCILISLGGLRAKGLEKNIELIIAREECRSGTFSFCFDGIDQPARMFPLMIPYDSLNILNGYDSAIYMLRWKDADSSTAKSPAITNVMQYDSLFDVLATKQNEVHYFNPMFKKQVNECYKRYKAKIAFDGYFYFHLYRLSATVEYLGKRQIIMPNLWFYGPQGNLQCSRLYDCYVITGISQIKPVVKGN